MWGISAGTFVQIRWGWLSCHRWTKELWSLSAPEIRFLNCKCKTTYIFFFLTGRSITDYLIQTPNFVGKEWQHRNLNDLVNITELMTEFDYNLHLLTLERMFFLTMPHYLKLFSADLKGEKNNRFQNLFLWLSETTLRKIVIVSKIWFNYF